MTSINERIADYSLAIADAHIDQHDSNANDELRDALCTFDCAEQMIFALIHDHRDDADDDELELIRDHAPALAAAIAFRFLDSLAAI